MHQSVDLTATPFEMLGGAPGVRKLAERFYQVMADDPAAVAIRHMHADDLTPMVQKLTGFLTGWLGGPRDYFDSPDAPCIMSVHRKYPIGASERDEWLACMSRALRDCGADARLRAMLEPAFARLADNMRSQ